MDEQIKEINEIYKEIEHKRKEMKERAEYVEKTKAEFDQKIKETIKEAEL
jgi:hypothetical protein